MAETEDKCACRNKELLTIPLVCHENDMEREDRKHKRLWIVTLVLIVALVGSNIAWVAYENSFEDVTTTTTIDAQQDGNGTNIVGGGNVDYGSESEDNKDH